MALARLLGGVESDGYRKIHKSPTPLLGGLAISIPFIAVALACLSEKTGMFQAVGGHTWDFAVLLAGCTGITMLGIVDDVRGMRARHKLLGQVLAATLVASSGCAIRAIGIPLVGTISLEHAAGLGPLLTVLWIVGITNAVNLIDGMDGLAAGVSLIATVSLGALAGLNGSPFVVLLCIALAGSLLAFLRYNWHPARIFLGDTGSMFLGFTLATLSLMGSYKTHGTVLMLATVMALGIPIFETLISMVRRYAGGFPIFTGDSRHTHHRLLLMGMSQRQAAAVLYAAGLLCFAAALLETMLPKDFPQSLIPSGIFMVTLVSIAVVAGYTRTISVKFRHRRETMRHLAFARYATMTLVPGASQQTVSRVMGLICEEFGLSFVAMEFDGGQGRIASANSPDHLHVVAHSRSIERLFVKASDGSRLEVVFEQKREAGPIARHTTAACLAQIFEGISAAFLEETHPKMKPGEMRTGITSLHRSPADRPGAIMGGTDSGSTEALKGEVRVEHTN